MVTALVAPIERRSPTQPDTARARAFVGLADSPTIVAMGPFDDGAYAQQLATAFIAVRRRCTAQLVLVGSGCQRMSVTRRIFAHGRGSDVHAVQASSDDRWSDLVAAADLVVLSGSSGSTTLLDVLAAGRPVIAPDDPETVQLVIPAIAGITYRPGDVAGLEGALLRLLTTPVLCHGMGGRARQVARRRHLENIGRIKAAG
jgi:glycosyltransferase involved in cell wall biosynthesis